MYVCLGRDIGMATDVVLKALNVKSYVKKFTLFVFRHISFSVSRC